MVKNYDTISNWSAVLPSGQKFKENCNVIFVFFIKKLKKKQTFSCGEIYGAFKGETRWTNYKTTQEPVWLLAEIRPWLLPTIVESHKKQKQFRKVKCDHLQITDSEYKIFFVVMAAKIITDSL